MPDQTTSSSLFPIRLNGRDAYSLEDLADRLIAEADDYVRRAPELTDEQREDFQLSSDALNFWRMYLRLREESKGADLDNIPDQLTELICAKRGYDPDEFEFAKAATEHRPRTVFGTSPLQLARLRARRYSFRLLVPGLKDSELATEIAALAWQLQQDVGPNSSILLPIEQLRILLGRRKVVVSGAVQKLIDSGVLRLVNPKYHTRRAREFVFAGQQGTHFEIDGETEDDE